MKKQSINDMLGAMVMATHGDGKHVVAYVRFPASAAPDEVHSVACYLSKSGAVRWLYDKRLLGIAYLKHVLREAEVA